MNTETTPEPLPSSPPAPDTTRRTTLYLLLAATVAAVLQIPFSVRSRQVTRNLGLQWPTPRQTRPERSCLHT